jgi:pullulanase/glycogen debranching enzyme
MLLMGDEVRRTQQGNNNAYCQDNEISWFDWNLCSPNADLLRFVRNMIRLRLNFNQGTGSGSDHSGRLSQQGPNRMARS